jgi:hypothetical protein
LGGGYWKGEGGGLVAQLLSGSSLAMASAYRNSVSLFVHSIHRATWPAVLGLVIASSKSWRVCSEAIVLVNSPYHSSSSSLHSSTRCAAVSGPLLRTQYRVATPSAFLAYRKAYSPILPVYICIRTKLLYMSRPLYLARTLLSTLPSKYRKSAAYISLSGRSNYTATIPPSLFEGPPLYSPFLLSNAGFK